MSKCVSGLRSCVLLFNLLFWVTGIIILALGLWLLWDPTASDYFALHSAYDGSFRIVGWLLVAAGAVMTFIGCCGCCGAYKDNACGLITFLLILMLVFCLELAAAVIAYQKQEQVRSYIETSMYDTIRNKYAADSAYKSAFDSIQKEFECCGVKGYKDWLQASWDRKPLGGDEDEARIEHGIGAIGGSGSGRGRVPSSCCNEHGLATYPTNCGVSFNQAPLRTYEQFLQPKGCADALYDSVNSHLDIIIAVCVIVGALQLLAMIITMALCCCVSKKDKQEYDY